MDWLKKTQLPKFYRYFFFRLYLFSKNVWDSQPAFSAMLMIAITMTFQLLFVLTIFGAAFGANILQFLYTGGPSKVLLLGLMLLIVSFLLSYHDNKWSKIIKEFQYESDKERTLGKYFLFIYLFVSLFCLLPISFWFDNLMK